MATQGVRHGVNGPAVARLPFIELFGGVGHPRRTPGIGSDENPGTLRHYSSPQTVGLDRNRGHRPVGIGACVMKTVSRLPPLRSVPCLGRV